MIDEQIKQISFSMCEQKEEEIKKAITHVIGRDNWTIEELKGRGSINIYPDKTELFVFDGVDLLRFYPIETKREKNSFGNIILKTTRNFERLYS